MKKSKRIFPTNNINSTYNVSARARAIKKREEPINLCAHVNLSDALAIAEASSAAPVQDADMHNNTMEMQRSSSSMISTVKAPSSGNKHVLQKSGTHVPLHANNRTATPCEEEESTSPNIDAMIAELKKEKQSMLSKAARATLEQQNILAELQLAKEVNSKNIAKATLTATQNRLCAANAARADLADKLGRAIEEVRHLKSLNEEHLRERSKMEKKLTCAHEKVTIFENKIRTLTQQNSPLGYNPLSLSTGADILSKSPPKIERPAGTRQLKNHTASRRPGMSALHEVILLKELDARWMARGNLTPPDRDELKELLYEDVDDRERELRNSHFINRHCLTYISGARRIISAGPLVLQILRDWERAQRTVLTISVLDLASRRTPEHFFRFVMSLKSTEKDWENIKMYTELGKYMKLMPKIPKRTGNKM